MQIHVVGHTGPDCPSGEEIVPCSSGEKAKAGLPSFRALWRTQKLEDGPGKTDE